MLLLTFRVAQDMYAVDVTRVVEVVPRIEPRPIPRTPPFLAGVFGYRGRVVPAIDMGLLLDKAAAPGRLSTRVILVEARNSRAGRGDETPRPNTLLLGLIAEQVNDVIRVDQEKTAFPSMHLDAAPFLGEMIQVDSKAQSLAQLIDVDRILPPPLRNALFGGWEKTDEYPDDAAESPRGAESHDVEADDASRKEVILGAGHR